VASLGSNGRSREIVKRHARLRKACLNQTGFAQNTTRVDERYRDVTTATPTEKSLLRKDPQTYWVVAVVCLRRQAGIADAPAARCPRLTGSTVFPSGPLSPAIIALPAIVS
jgi:hypothetical protein